MGVVDEIKSRLDIVDFVTAYVPSLKKAGRTYKGLCPFHAEKTPSFVVFPETQSWHCFGACSTGGDIFTFLMRREGYTFGEALKVLADRAGVPLRERTPEEEEADRTRQKLFDLVAAAADFFHRLLLQSPQAEFARAYVQQRGLSPQTVRQFQLGYAPDGWETLKRHLQERGYREADLLAAGLIVARDDGSPGYDRFRDRLVVPIRDLRGRVVGFGARALHDNQVPKYLNSPQTPLFDKSTLLYALDVAKNAIRDTGQAVIVEGYMDALQAHEHGFRNVVAQMGTALTEPQLKQLRRFTNTFILALDADSAGSAATLRGIHTARQTLAKTKVGGFTPRGEVRLQGELDADIRIAALPPGKDPDDLLREGTGAWQKVVDTALPLVDYYIQTVTARLDLNTARGKAVAVQEILPLLRELGNPIEQEHYLQQLARIVKIEERTLKAELQRTPGIAAPPPPPPPPLPPTRTEAVSPAAPADTTATARLEAYCLAMLIGQPAALEQVNQTLFNQGQDVLAVEDFTSTENGALFLLIKRWAAEDAPLDTLTAQAGDHLAGRLASLIDLWHSQPASPIEHILRELPKIILRLRRRRLKAQIKTLNQLQKEALENDDPETVVHCQTLIAETNRKLKQVDHAHNALSIMGQRRTEEKYIG
ncbi:MAG: DNA primase [Caldilineae bacterium]|nr:MAG: DNA primase [Caldilineae bacterium]